MQHHREAIVLTLHRVLDSEAFEKTHSPAGMIIQQQTFVDLITALESEAAFISLDDLPRRSSGSSPRLLVALTFDDGWSDNLRVCIDVLVPHAIPACIFICPAMVGRVLPFWPERALAGLRAMRISLPVPQDLIELFSAYGVDLLKIREHDLLQFLKGNPGARTVVLAAFERSFPLPSNTVDTTMTWIELRKLMQHGIALGSHTAHHEILPSLTSPEQVAELLECDGRMAAELSVSPSFFSYPDGGWNEDAKRSVSSCGYRFAFINATGVWSEKTDPLLVPRINLSQNRLVGPDGNFSIAATHYYLFWLPYLNRRRSRKMSSTPAYRTLFAALLRSISIDRSSPIGKRRRG